MLASSALAHPVLILLVAAQVGAPIPLSVVAHPTLLLSEVWKLNIIPGIVVAVATVWFLAILAAGRTRVAMSVTHRPCRPHGGRGLCRLVGRGFDSSGSDAYRRTVPTYRITIAYDGTDFRGYAANPGVRTIQGELEATLARMTGSPVPTTVAGRTDAGVHPRANVVSFKTMPSSIPSRLRRSITSMLGPEVVATDAAVVPDGFSARFSAGSRHYPVWIRTRVRPPTPCCADLRGTWSIHSI